MNKRTLAPFVPVVLSLACASAQAQPHTSHIEEVTVTATPFKDAIAETMLPVNVLTGEELSRKAGATLGATLGNEPGIHSSSFGTGVGQPVIRGHTGNRVQVVQSGVDVTDASDVSPDHANGVEPLLADRIEVLRGPSTLLYGNGAIGGVVNVIDNRIPQSLDQDRLFIGEQTYDSVNNGRKTLVRLDGSAGNIAMHFDAVSRRGDNVDIPGSASLEDDAEDNTFGFIGNSDSEGDSIHVGASAIGERGFVGFSVGRITSNYGLPPGVHSHEHGHDDDHEGEEHHDEEHGDEAHSGEEHEHGEEEVAIRLDMEQTRYDLKAHYDFEGGLFEMIDAQIGFTDYEHSEIEIEEGASEIGTVYTNRGFDSRIALTHAPIGALTGVIGLQFASTEFSAVGEEAYIDPADIDSAALFLVERIEGEQIDWEFGARIANQSVDPDSACRSSETTSSLSASLRYAFLDESNTLFSVSRSERAPTVEELYSNVTGAACSRPADDDSLVLHAATDLLEVGNPDLEVEVSNNIELGLRHRGGNFTATINAFYNAIDDYVYLTETGEHEGETIASYTGRDATFRGIEAAVDWTVAEFEAGVIDINVFTDLVRAEFDGGDKVPRIPPVRIGAGFAFTNARSSLGIDVVQAFDQNRIADFETQTNGYVRLGAHADYRWPLANAEAMVFIRGDNLLDDDIRSHVSLLKDIVPEPGRNVQVGLRLTF